MLILGIGSPFADDQLGWEVAKLIRECSKDYPEIQAQALDRPGPALLERIAGQPHVVLIDAMKSGAAPGSVRQLTLDELDYLHAPVSTHNFSLAETLKLGEKLGMLPTHLDIFGIEMGLPPQSRQEQTEKAARRILAALGY